MRRPKRVSLLTLAAVSVLILALMLPSLALADDTPPPPETQEEEITSETETESSEEVTGDEEAPASEATTEEEASPVTEPSPTEVTSAGEPTEEAAAEPETEDLTVSEALEQAPEGTEIVVLNADGQIEPLASQEAAEILVSGDPVWCPGSNAPTPGANGCTSGSPSFAGLLTELSGGGFTGPGTIWVEGTYDATNDSAPIEFDGSATGFSGLTDLTVQGGWDGTSGSSSTSGSSTLDDAFWVNNWQGNVTLNDLIINADDVFAGLAVQTDGDITLNNVDANNNPSGSGAYLDSCDYDISTGLCANTGNITVNDSDFNSNATDGLVIDSGGDTSLDNVQADNNGLDGAYITGADDNGTGNISIQGSQFNGNANGTGLDVYSDGNVTLTNVTADANFTGMILDTTPGTGTLDVTTSQTSDNTGTGLHAESYGDISLSQLTASNNSANGAYLFAYDLANVSVDNSYFEANGNYGLFAKSFAGDIQLTNVEVNGGPVTPTTNIGAFLKTYESGNVQVDTSDFYNNLQSGLVVVSSGDVTLNGVLADNNGKHGAEAYSKYAYTCHGVNNIVVNVDAGTYSNNANYGLYVKPGASGTLNMTGSPTFSGNGSGDYVLVLEDPSCQKVGKKPSSNKGPKIVEVPFADGPTVDQDCEQYSGTILKLPNGTSVKVGCPYTGGTQLEGVEEGNLPGTLGAGATFTEGISVNFNNEGQPVDQLTEGGLLTLSFEIPEGVRARRFSILFWDPTADDGEGAWIKLPPYELGTVFKLNPDDPDDGRTITSGVRQKGNTVTATVNFPGIFVLATE